MRALHDRRGGAGAAAMASSTTTTTAQSAPPVSGGGGCTPHLKRVLKSYQASAVSSLQGPPALMAASAAVDPGGLGDEDEPLEAPALPVIQQPPLLTPPDQAHGSERDETQLEWNKNISCFTVGGEQRLCLPQILNTVLTDLSLPQINAVFTELQIYCLRCNPEQLDVFKRDGVIPSGVASCGLITKSDAERLCAALLHAGVPAAEVNSAIGGPTVGVPVYHECFGGGSGVLCLEAAMVRCRDCNFFYSPRRFVLHGHGSREKRTCHWGFDSGRWRNYLLLDDREPLEDADAMRALLQQFKDKYPDAAKRKQSPVQPDLLGKKRAARTSLSDIEGDGIMAAVVPGSAYWYCQQAQWARTSAFKPWSPVLLKEQKAARRGLTLEDQLRMGLAASVPPVYLKHNLAYPAGAYHPEDVAEMQKLGIAVLKADPDRLDAAATSPISKKAVQVPMDVVPKKEHVPTACSRSLESASGGVPPAGKLVNGRLSADTEETMSNSSLSTLSGVEDVTMAEDGKEGAPMITPELRGLWVAFDRHSLGERARQDIMHEVNLLLSSCQQQHFFASYKLLLQQRQEAEPSCKLGSMAKGSDMPSPRLPPPTSTPTSPPGSTHQTPTASSPEAVPHGSPPVNSREAKEPAAHSPQPPPKPPVEQHKMLLAA